MPASREPEELETAFEKYAVGALIGEGGVGRVYAGSDSAGAPVAIKLLYNATSDKRRRFKNEINFLAKNIHPNIVRVLDYGMGKIGPARGAFYVMPRYDGSLRDHIGKIAPDNVLRWFGRILDGVEAAHLKGVVHRDLKPENILVDQKAATPLIADFGIARFHEDELATAVETGPGQRLANFQYAAPEQRTRGGTIDQRTDIYALGLMLNELFTGTVPHGTDYAQIASIDKNLGFLDKVVDRMIRQSQDGRPSTIAEVKEAILKYQAEAISLQKISKIDATVIPAGQVDEPLAVEAPKLVGVEWADGRLALHLDRPVNPGWVRALQHGMGGHTAVLGKGPESFEFQGNTASVYIPEYSAQQAINHFKAWLPRATVAYSDQLRSDAERQRQAHEQRLRTERQREEQYLKVNSSLQI